MKNVVDDEPDDIENRIKAEVESKIVKGAMSIKCDTTSNNTKENNNGAQQTIGQVAAEKQHQVPIMKSPLMTIKQFIKQLSSPFYDGRVLLNIDQASRSTSSLKYILLNPGICFDEIASQARAVILAGGTMKPVGFIVVIVIFFE